MFSFSAKTPPTMFFDPDSQGVFKEFHATVSDQLAGPFEQPKHSAWPKVPILVYITHILQPKHLYTGAQQPWQDLSNG